MNFIFPLSMLYFSFIIHIKFMSVCSKIIQLACQILLNQNPAELDFFFFYYFIFRKDSFTALSTAILWTCAAWSPVKTPVVVKGGRGTSLVPLPNFFDCFELFGHKLVRKGTRRTAYWGCFHRAKLHEKNGSKITKRCTTKATQKICWLLGNIHKL